LLVGGAERRHCGDLERAQPGLGGELDRGVDCGFGQLRLQREHSPQSTDDLGVHISEIRARVDVVPVLDVGARVGIVG